jgi:hypothetical protein
MADGLVELAAGYKAERDDLLAMEDCVKCAEERERCAKVAEAKGRTTDPAFPVFAMEAVAAAIRELE